MIYRIGFAAAALVVAAISHADAVPLTYDMENGEGQASGGAFDYWDQTYNGTGDTTVDAAPLSGGTGQMLDGVTGVDDWEADLGNGNAYEWLGWINTNPTITFDFGSTTAFTNASFHTNNNGVGGVGMWGSADFSFSDDGVTFGGDTTRTTTALERADPTARYLTSDLSASGRYLRVHFNDGDQPWIFISEAKFNTSPVPEPGSMAVLGLGVVALLRRKRKA